MTTDPDAEHQARDGDGRGNRDANVRSPEERRRFGQRNHDWSGHSRDGGAGSRRKSSPRALSPNRHPRWRVPLRRGRRRRNFMHFDCGSLAWRDVRQRSSRFGKLLLRDRRRPSDLDEALSHHGRWGAQRISASRFHSAHASNLCRHVDQHPLVGQEQLRHADREIDIGGLCDSKGSSLPQSLRLGHAGGSRKVPPSIRRNDVLEYRWLRGDVDAPSTDCHQELSGRDALIDAGVACTGAGSGVGDMHVVSAGMGADILSRGDGRCGQPEYRIVDLRRVGAEAIGDPRAGALNRRTILARRASPDDFRSQQLVPPARRDHGREAPAMAGMHQLDSGCRTRCRDSVRTQDQDRVQIRH